MKNITVQELKEMLKNERDDNSVAFVDVCSTMEYREHHINGFRNIPIELLTQHSDELKNKKKIVVQCFSGGRSKLATQILESQGVTAELINVQGGILAWHNAGYPIE